MVCDK